jgi:hypothetical protein
MKWTKCFLVRELRSRRIVHHEIEEINTTELLAPDRASREEAHIHDLMRHYHPDDFEVFVQGFDSLDSLYSAWPELIASGKSRNSE